MKTGSVMKENIWDSITNFLGNLGIVWKYLLNGFIGATVWAIYRKEKFFSALRQIIIGGLISGYFTPVIVKRAAIDLEYVGFISFVIGMLGMVIIDSAYKYALNNYKKWSQILKILFTNK